MKALIRLIRAFVVRNKGPFRALSITNYASFHHKEDLWNILKTLVASTNTNKLNIDTTSNICKKQIHDVGTKVYLHTYNNEKRERDRFIKKKKKKKKKS